VTDPRPTQLEVDAKAAEMFGRKWKDYPQHQIAEWNAFITRHLDMARDAVMAARR
jgi:predicted phosphohydrolase